MPFPWLQIDKCQPLCCIAVTCAVAARRSPTVTLNDFMICCDVLYLCGASGTFAAISITLLICDGPRVSDTQDRKLAKPVYLFLAAPLLHGQNISVKCFM